MTSPEKPDDINPRVTHEILPGDLEVAKKIEKTILELQEYEKILQEKMIEAAKDHSEPGKIEWMKLVDALEKVRASIAKEKKTFKNIASRQLI